ncbi:hypothetical protein VFSR5_0656 [Aliivibrio fischeri SR5]|uniref:Uncharacterized protein n=1 Tax=Aliivibrio fischeri SR5 TaxID=1088719 RepID=A0AAV3EVT3_ALIFS|nr:hypothetical protein VFSR5_0656 [Aliivibrio fischeri SR5]
MVNYCPILRKLRFVTLFFKKNTQTVAFGVTSQKKILYNALAIAEVTSA